jgi:hypothetical protein
MRVWLAFVILGLGLLAAQAMPPSEQIIIFGGGNSSASGGGGGGCAGAALKFNVACNSQYLAVVH